MRASRLVSLLLILQSRPARTARELAGELGVSVRTIHRDVEALGEAGVPIYTERGPHGGVRLVDGYRTRLTGLTADEAESLFLAGAPGPAAQLGLGTVLAAAQLKVLAALPPELRGRAARVQERFHLDAPGWFRSEESLPHLATVADAVWDQRRLDVRYRRGRRVVARRLDPLGLVLKAGVWYLVARHRGRLLTYRVGRLARVAPRRQRFERPDGFDLAAHWARASVEFEQTMMRLPVTVRIAPEGMWILGGLERAAADAGRASAELDAELPGWTRMVIPQESVDVAAAELMRFGADLEVIDPPEVRARIAASARGMAVRYADVATG